MYEILAYIQRAINAIDNLDQDERLDQLRRKLVEANSIGIDIEEQMYTNYENYRGAE